MNEPNWIEIVPNLAVNGPTQTLWVKVYDFVRGPRRLRVEATGQWTFDGHTSCGPDGCPAEGFEDGNLHKQALRGCLLAKIGGSAGDTPGSEKIVATGSYCVFDIGESAAGALFVTMNDNPKHFSRHTGQLHVTVAESPSW